MFRPKPSVQSSINRQKYIPPTIQQAINKQVSSKLPVNMQQYMQGGYVPPQAQKLIAKQMDNLPTHLKQYSGAYMEQTVLRPSMNSQPAMAMSAAGATSTVQPHPPVNLMRQDRSAVVPGEQPQARFMDGLFASDQSAAPAAAGATPSPSGPTTNYDFFMNPAAAPPPRRFNVLGGQSFPKRILLIGIGLVVVVIVIVGLSSLLGGSGDTAQLTKVAQDQNELARVATEASSQQDAVQTTQNLAQSVQLSITSAQQQLLTYMKSNGQNVGTKLLAATKDAKTDQELTAAEAASNFDPVFGQVMQSGLQGYAQDIKTAYPLVGSKGKVLLQSEYNGAQLLLTQANAVASSLQAQ